MIRARAGKHLKTCLKIILVAILLLMLIMPTFSFGAGTAGQQGQQDQPVPTWNQIWGNWLTPTQNSNGFCVNPSQFNRPNDDEFFNQVISMVMGAFENLLNQLLQLIFGTPILNLNQTTDYISKSVIDGFKASTKSLIKSYMQPGILNINYCYYNFDPLKENYYQMITAGQFTPSAASNYYTELVKSGSVLGQSGRPAITYPVPPGSGGDPVNYVRQVGSSTILMGGPGTGIRQFLSQNADKLPPHERYRLDGDIQRLDALTEVNMHLAVTGAETSVYSRKVAEELESYNPEAWDPLLFSQVIKDIGKLLYLQNQLMAKLIDIQGQMAIQMAAIAQLHTDEFATKLYGKWLQAAPVEQKK